MTRQVKGLLFFFLSDLRHSFTIFWSILLIALALSLGIAYLLLDVQDGVFFFGFPFATYINVGIVGFLIVKDYIPFSLKLGAVRKNIFAAAGVLFVLYGFIMAMISSTLHSIINLIIEAVGLHSFMFLHPAQLIGSDTWLTRIAVDTVMMFGVFALFFLLALLFYRGGLIIGGSVVGLIGVTLLFGIAQGWLFEFFLNLYHTIDYVFFAQVFGISILIYGLTYFLVRGITTVKA